MRFVTQDLQDKITAGSATSDEQIIYRMLSVVGDANLTPHEAAQLIRQAEAICDAKDRLELQQEAIRKAGATSADMANALIELFSTDSLEVRRTANGGLEFRLTDLGLDQAAALVAQLSGKVN